MMGLSILVSIIILTFSNAFAQERPALSVDDGLNGVTYSVGFSDYAEGPVENWLESKGFKFKDGIMTRSKLDLDIDDGALVIKAKEPVRGFLANESVEVKDYSKVRIEWGIRKYPDGASYEKGIRNEALILYIFFGDKKISSGSIFIPNRPYFVGLFLCKDERPNYPYKGRYYHEGGRFVCLGKPKPGERVVSEFDLKRGFQSYFGKNEVPVISGISLGMDTTSSGDGGKAAAFIKSIKFVK
jgi:hypothetical protein